MSTEPSSPNKLSWSPDGKWIATTVGPISGYALTLCSIDGNGSCREINAHHGMVESVAWSPDGSKIASVGVDGIIYLWNTTVLTSDELIFQ